MDAATLATIIGSRITDTGLVGTTRRGEVTGVRQDPDGFLVDVVWSNGTYNTIRPTSGRYNLEVSK